MFLLWSCSLVNVLCCVIFYPSCELSEYIVVGIALSPTLTMSVPANGPGVFHEFLPGHQHRSTEVRSQDCSNHRSGLTMGAKGAAQTLAWSNIHVYVLVKSTAAKARPISDAGALIHSDILQVLSFQSQQQWCKSMAVSYTHLTLPTIA